MTRKARHRAALKGAKTKAINRGQLRYYNEITRPSYLQLQNLFNYLLRGQKISLRFNPGRTERKLKKGAEYGTLVGIRGGFFFVVLPDGYKRPIQFYPAFWEVLIP